MARCDGCAGSRCSCKIIAGANVVVAGVGTSTDPYVITSQGEEGQAVPTGAIIMFTTAVAPAGWLVANGQAVSRTTYAALFAVIGTTYGDGGGGGTHFTLPDLAGAFPLGADGSHALASTGGSETTTLVSANLPPHAHTIAHQHDLTHGHTASSGNVDINHTHGFDVGGGGHEHNFVYPSSANDIPQGTGNVWTQVARGAQVLLGTSGGGGHIHSGVTYGMAGGINQVHAHSVTVNATGGLTGGSTVANSGNGPGSSSPFANMPPYLALTFLIKT